MAKDTDEMTQLRAEVAMLRAQVQTYESTRQQTEADKAEHARFLAWVALTAEQKTQLAADLKFAGLGGGVWQVALQEHPTIRVPGHSEYEAVGRYKEICGIITTGHEIVATPLTAAV